MSRVFLKNLIIFVAKCKMYSKMQQDIEEIFENQRRDMVDYQLISRGISDQRVISVMKKVPRHKFVPENIRDASYEDCALPIGEGQTISQPYMVAIMTELLDLTGNEKVLEIGTGSGYQAAILAELSSKVYSIERIKLLAERAKKVLEELGYKNIEIIVGDGSQGYEKTSPYDGIIVTAGCPDIPKTLVEQLAEGGRLVIPVGERFHQILTKVIKHGTETTVEEGIGCVFVPLIGKYGWPAY